MFSAASLNKCLKFQFQWNKTLYCLRLNINLCSCYLFHKLCLLLECVQRKFRMRQPQPKKKKRDFLLIIVTACQGCVRHPLSQHEIEISKWDCPARNIYRSRHVFFLKIATEAVWTWCKQLQHKIYFWCVRPHNCNLTLRQLHLYLALAR